MKPMLKFTSLPPRAEVKPIRRRRAITSPENPKVQTIPLNGEEQQADTSHPFSAMELRLAKWISPQFNEKTVAAKKSSGRGKRRLTLGLKEQLYSLNKQPRKRRRQVWKKKESSNENRPPLRRNRREGTECTSNGITDSSSLDISLYPSVNHTHRKLRTHVTPPENEGGTSSRTPGGKRQSSTAPHNQVLGSLDLSSVTGDCGSRSPDQQQDDCGPRSLDLSSRSLDRSPETDQQDDCGPRSLDLSPPADHCGPISPETDQQDGCGPGPGLLHTPVLNGQQVSLGVSPQNNDGHFSIGTSSSEDKSSARAGDDGGDVGEKVDGKSGSLRTEAELEASRFKFASGDLSDLLSSMSIDDSSHQNDPDDQHSHIHHAPNNRPVPNVTGPPQEIRQGTDLIVVPTTTTAGINSAGINSGGSGSSSGTNSVDVVGTTDSTNASGSCTVNVLCSAGAGDSATTATTAVTCCLPHASFDDLPSFQPLSSSTPHRPPAPVTALALPASPPAASPTASLVNLDSSPSSRSNPSGQIESQLSGFYSDFMNFHCDSIIKSNSSRLHSNAQSNSDSTKSNSRLHFSVKSDSNQSDSDATRTNSCVEIDDVISPPRTPTFPAPPPSTVRKSILKNRKGFSDSNGASPCLKTQMSKSVTFRLPGEEEKSCGCETKRERSSDWILAMETPEHLWCRAFPPPCHAKVRDMNWEKHKVVGATVMMGTKVKLDMTTDEVVDVTMASYIEDEEMLSIQSSFQQSLSEEMQQSVLALETPVDMWTSPPFNFINSTFN